jgi:ABC-type transport system substrate-binding protein
VSAAAIFGFVAAGCGKSETKPEEAKVETFKPKRGGTLTFAKNGPPITLDPALTKETESTIVVGNLFDGLVRQRAGRTAIDPALARSWEISPDGLRYTFFLRTGVTFHDSTAFNADAVVVSIERQHDPRHKFHRGQDFDFWRNFDMDRILREVRAVNDSTVEFVLFKKDATFLNLLSLNFMAIVSPSAIARYGKDFWRNPVGCGPFRFVSWEPDGTIITSAFDQYWDGRPYVDTLVLKPIPDARLRWQMLKAGQIDIMATPHQADIDEIEHTPGVKYSKQPGLNVGYLAINTEKKPFNNLKIRQAIVYAINRDSLVKEVFGALGRPAKNPIPPILLGYNEEIHFTPFDPQKSRDLLAEAGFPNGFKCKLWTMPIARDYMPNGRRAAELIQKDLKAVGIETDIVVYPWEEFLQRRGNGEHDLSISGWVGDAPDPHFFFYPLLDKMSAQKKPSTNVAFYKSDAMHDLIREGMATADAVERSRIYKDACKVFNDDLPWFDIAHSVSVVPMREYVMDFQQHSSAYRKFEKVWLNK